MHKGNGWKEFILFILAKDEHIFINSTFSVLIFICVECRIDKSRNKTAQIIAHNTKILVLTLLFSNTTENLFNLTDSLNQ